jgi:hypothetical protein
LIIDPVYVHPAKKIVNVKCWSFLRGSPSKRLCSVASGSELISLSEVKRRDSFGCTSLADNTLRF